jgi:hypothetical protein
MLAPATLFWGTELQPIKPKQNIDMINAHDKTAFKQACCVTIAVFCFMRK